MVSLLRIIKFAFQDIARNLGLSLMTVFILVLMLVSVNMLWSVKILTTEAVTLVKDQVNVSLYLNGEVTDKDVTSVTDYIKSFPEVTSLKTLTRAEVLQTFKDRHQVRTEVLQALEELGGNPFGPTLVITAREPGDYTKIIDALNVPEYDHLIEAKSFDGHEAAIDRIQIITNRVEKIGLGLSLVFAIISFLIIFNTIRVAIYTQRVEISIKRLVGANNWFIRGPYLVESVIFTFISLVITGGLIYFTLSHFDPYLSVVFPSSFSLTSYYKLHILFLCLIQGGAVLFLTTISSSLAMSKNLKV